MPRKPPALVLNLARLYPPQNGGISRVAWILSRYAARLAQQGKFRVYFVVGWRFAPQFREWIAIDGGTVLPLRPNEQPGPALRALHPHIVIHPLFGVEPLMNWPGYQDALHIAFMPDALALDHPELFPESELAERIKAYQKLTSADWICTISNFSRTRLIAHLGLPPERVRVFYLAGDLPAPHHEPNLKSYLPFWEEGTPYLFYPANFWPHKRHDLLLAILQRLHASGHPFHLVLTGHDPRHRLTALLERYAELKPFVHYLGLVPEEVLVTLYRYAYALPFVSEYEGFGMPILEAMTYGCPVVTRALASIPEVAGKAALYVDSEDPDTWVRALIEILPAQKEHLRARGQEQARKFTWTAFEARWHAFFEDIARGLQVRSSPPTLAPRESHWTEEMLLWNADLQQTRQQIEEKEQALQQLAKQLTEKEQALQALHQKYWKQISALQDTLGQFQRSLSFWLLHGPLRHHWWYRYPIQAVVKVRRFFLPRVGVLHQYPPRPIAIPKRYYRHPPIPEDELPTISIVTPSYNQARYLEATIQSVLEQGYPKLEYIVQDGGSTDGTAQILDKYRDRLAYVESAPDRGQAHAINKGFARSTGEIMAWINSDDILLPGALWFVADYFRRHPEVDVIYGHRVIINEEGLEIGRWVLPPHEDQVVLWADYIPQESLFWRRRIWEKVGAALDESFHFALDWDLIIRFLQAGARFHRVPRFLAAFRVHAEQKTSRQIHHQGWEEMQRIRKRIHGREVTQEEVLQHIQGYLRRSLLYHFLYRMGILRY